MKTQEADNPFCSWEVPGAMLLATETVTRYKTVSLVHAF